MARQLMDNASSPMASPALGTMAASAIDEARHMDTTMGILRPRVGPYRMVNRSDSQPPTNSAPNAASGGSCRGNRS